jgi:hypothetical protein
LLESVPLGVTTWTSPVVAPAGTVVVISELETTVKVAATPLNLSLKTNQLTTLDRSRVGR